VHEGLGFGVGFDAGLGVGFGVGVADGVAIDVTIRFGVTVVVSAFNVACVGAAVGVKSAKVAALSAIAAALTPIIPNTRRLAAHTPRMTCTFCDLLRYHSQPSRSASPNLCCLTRK